MGVGKQRIPGPTSGKMSGSRDGLATRLQPYDSHAADSQAGIALGEALKAEGFRKGQDESTVSIIRPGPRAPRHDMCYGLLCSKLGLYINSWSPCMN